MLSQCLSCYRRSLPDHYGICVLCGNKFTSRSQQTVNDQQVLPFPIAAPIIVHPHGQDSQSTRISIETVLLSNLTEQIATVVNEQGTIGEHELQKAYEERFNIEIPHLWQPMFMSFVNSTYARKMIDRDVSTGDWTDQGNKKASSLSALDDWTIESVKEAIQQLKNASVPKNKVFDLMCDRVWNADTKIPMPVKKLLGKAIHIVY